MEEAKEELTCDEIVEWRMFSKESAEFADIVRTTDVMEIGS